MLQVVLIFSAAVGSTFDRQYWVDISPPLAPGDTITAIQYGPGAEEIWVGSWDGYIYRSLDDGVTYYELFRPVEAEPLVEPRLGNSRAAYLPDLGRGLNDDTSPSSRGETARQSADLAGLVRDRPRQRSSPLLSSLLRPSARTTVEVKKFFECHGYRYVTTGTGVWQSKDGFYWKLLPVGYTMDRERVSWLSCDRTKPGRFVLNTAHGVLETLDDGGTFHPYITLLPSDIDAFDTASLAGDGRMVILSDNRLYIENEARNAYEEVCNVYPDSIDSTPRYMLWQPGSARGIVVTGDGLMICDPTTARMSRYSGEIFSRRDIAFATERGREVIVVTKSEIFQSNDRGKTFREVFRSPSTDALSRISTNGDKLLVHGGRFIWRRVEQTSSSRVDVNQLRRVGTRYLEDAYAGKTSLSKRTYRPFDEIVAEAMKRFRVRAPDLAAARAKLRFRGLMPTVRASIVSAAASSSLSLFDRAPPTRDLVDDARGTRFGWQVFAAWDLGTLVQDREQTDVQWRDLERLRYRLIERLRDAYDNWQRVSRRLESRKLSPTQRAALTLRLAEAAAYLDQMTRGQFAEFSQRR